MCSNVGSMARNGSFCNSNPRGSSPSCIEHGLCRQTESHNGGTIAPQRTTERAAIFSATNGTTRGERSQQLFQAARAWQAKRAGIGGLWKQLKEEWETKLEEQKRKHDLEIKQLKREVEEGIRKSKSLEEDVKRGQKYQEQLRKKASLEYDEMSEKRDEMRKEAQKEREEKWKKNLRYWDTEAKRGNYKMS